MVPTGQPLPQSHRRQHHKRRQQQTEQPHRPLANRPRSAQVPRCTQHHHRQRPQRPARARRPRRLNPSQIQHKDDGIDRHVEHTRRQTQPRLLKSPEPTQRPPHPAVVSTLLRQRRSQLSHHQTRRQTPNQRHQRQQQQRPPIPRLADDVFQPIRPTRHHKVGRRNQRQQPHLLRASQPSRHPTPSYFPARHKSTRPCRHPPASSYNCLSQSKKKQAKQRLLK